MRRKTRTIKVGNLLIGSPFPVSIQSMTNTPTEDFNATLKQIKELEDAGCEIVRITIPTIKAAKNIKQFIKNSRIPIIADIHFNHKLALMAISQGIHGIRINPGNIGSKENIRAIAKAATEANVPIRVGANSGSLPQNYRIKQTTTNTKEAKRLFISDALVESALHQCQILEKEGFYNIKVSLKASDVITAVMAYRKFAKITDYPLHLGITEAGTYLRSTIKSSIGIGSLLLEGIGDTIRVSITGNPIEEVKIAQQILENTGHRLACPEIISCPTCGRTNIDIIKITTDIEKKINQLKSKGNKFKPSKIAIMGCAVNGPGEAKDADCGIAGASKNKLAFFKNGKIVGVFDKTKALKLFYEELVRLSD